MTKISRSKVYSPSYTLVIMHDCKISLKSVYYKSLHACSLYCNSNEKLLVLNFQAKSCNHRTQVYVMFQMVSSTMIALYNKLFTVLQSPEIIPIAPYFELITIKYLFITTDNFLKGITKPSQNALISPHNGINDDFYRSCVLNNYYQCDIIPLVQSCGYHS